METNTINKDILTRQLRELLNRDKIKLWLPPYTTADKEKGEMPEELVNKLSADMQMLPDEVRQALEELRLHAITKLTERDKFQQQGVATLKIKVTCPLSNDGPSRRLLSLECDLSNSGRELKTMVSQRLDECTDNLKLISKGRVIAESKTLNEQGVKHGSDVMAICMSASEAKLAQRETEILEVEKARKAAELLSSRGDDDDDFDVQIADQNGQPLSLPKEEKKALTLAMTLYEKGRSALKDKKISHALLLLLEADAEFSKCSAGILNSVDNYGILCLDVTWCYLLLKNLDQLPDAETRLQRTESCFKKCYGEKMERLTAIKGGTETEQALFMRLYLLQGIVAFHKGEMRNAANLLRRAEFVLTLLHVDEDKLTEVMSMGFTEREARIALRAKNGNVQQAVDHIIIKRKEQEETNKKAKQEWKQRVRGKDLGKTADGQRVNLDLYDSLVAMEFPRGAAAEALRQTNNNINLAIEFLQTHPEILSLPDPETKKKHLHITEEMIQQIVGLGFNLEMAQQALRLSHGDIQRAIDQLLQSGGMLPHSSTSTSNSMSDFSTSSESSMTESESISRALKKEEKDELDSFVSDINTDANDHLDLTLSEETDVLRTYQAMVSSFTSSGQ